MANSVRKMIALMVVTTTPAKLMGFRETFANRFFIKETSIGSCFNTDQHRAIRPVKSGKIPVHGGVVMDATGQAAATK
jgi:hypothetical protein